LTDLASQRVHSSWISVLEPFTGEIDRILEVLDSQKVAPSKDQIFASLEIDLNSVKCVIVGQDPYPTAGNAHGLAFSVSRGVKKVPASLRNIFKELSDDLSVDIPTHGCLENWRDEGVLLLNRVLTTEVGRSNAHTNLGWQPITEAIAKAAADRGAVGVLWGVQAQELAPNFQYKVSAPHPSPLSAYKGFFGSKPFSAVNKILEEQGRTPINWVL
jgi:uracil-DNA glycosylase